MLQTNDMIHVECTKEEDKLYAYFTENYPYLNTDSIHFQKFLHYDILNQYTKAFSFTEEMVVAAVQENKLTGYIENILRQREIPTRKVPFQIEKNYTPAMTIQFYDKDGDFLVGTRDPREYFPFSKECETVVTSKRYAKKNPDGTFMIYHTYNCFERPKETEYQDTDLDLLEFALKEKEAYFLDNEKERSIEEENEKNKTRVYIKLPRKQAM